MLIKLKEKITKPSDYCVFATNLPPFQNQSDVKEWIESLHRDIEVVDVMFLFDTSKMAKLEKKLWKLKKMKSYVISYRDKILRKHK